MLRQIKNFYGALLPDQDYLVALKSQRSGTKTVGGFSIILIFERKYDALKSKSPCILLNKNTNFNKNENGKSHI